MKCSGFGETNVSVAMCEITRISFLLCSTVINLLDF